MERLSKKERTNDPYTFSHLFAFNVFNPFHLSGMANVILSLDTETRKWWRSIEARTRGPPSYIGRPCFRTDPAYARRESISLFFKNFCWGTRKRWYGNRNGLEILLQDSDKDFEDKVSIRLPMVMILEKTRI